MALTKMMCLTFATVVLVSKFLSSGRVLAGASGGEDCDEATQLTILWVKASVPVEILQLFISGGLCSESSSHQHSHSFIEPTCKFVRNLTDRHVSRDGDSYVESRMQLMHESSNKVNFSCGDMKKMHNRITSLGLKDELATTNVMYDLHDAVVMELFYPLTDSQRCNRKCKDVMPLCSVAATLTNITLEEIKAKPCLPDSPASSPAAKTCPLDQVTGWVKAGVPVNISKLLLPDNGLCAVKSSNATQPQKSMCSFVKTLTKDYVNAKSAGKGRDKSTAYVYEAIGRLGVGNSLLDFNCSLWTNITEKAANILVNQEESKAVPEPQKVPVPQNLSTTVKSVSGFFTNDTVSCEEECRGAWKAVCGVTAALLDVLPKKPVTPTVGAPESAKDTKDWIDFLPQIPVNISKPFQSDGLCNLHLSKLTKFQNATCALIKTIAREYLAYLIAKYNGKRHDNTTALVYGKIGSSNFSLDFNCSLWENITGASRVDGLKSNIVLGSKKLSMALKNVTSSLNKANANECKKVKCDSSWKAVCGVVVVLLDTLPKVKAIPTNMKEKPVPPGNRTTPFTATRSPILTSSGATDSMVPILIVTIAAVGVAFTAYIVYHNREVLGKMCGSGGGKKGRPKRKNYKYLKSVKDALS